MNTTIQRCSGEVKQTQLKFLFQYKRIYLFLYPDELPL